MRLLHTPKVPSMKVDITRVDDEHLTVSARNVTVTIDRGAPEGEPSDGFRATELLLGGLGACMMGTTIYFARNQGLALDDLSISLEGETANQPSRVDRIRISMTVTGDLTEKEIATLGRVASGCKVHNTLEHSPKIDFGIERATIDA